MGVTQVAVSNWEKKGSISLKNYLKFCQLQDSLVPPTSTFTDSSILNEHQQDNTPYQTEERL
nr:hypothetical protein B11C_40182 [Bartonella schoenbuchensis R1]